MSSYEDVLADCAQHRKLFEDPEFPATNSSIFYDKEDSRIIWKRPRELCDNPKFLVEGASRHDLDQGNLGDCWFLGAAATLSMHTELFQQVVPPQQSFTDENYAGVFRFQFWRFGEWQEVLVDDRLPCKNNKLVFCSNRESPDEFWSSLLEKAYAKSVGHLTDVIVKTIRFDRNGAYVICELGDRLAFGVITFLKSNHNWMHYWFCDRVHGSYQALTGGFGHEALVDFTGGIGEFIDLTDNPNGEKLAKRLDRTHRRKTLIVATIAAESSDTSARETVQDNGLVAGHAYSLTGIVTVDGVQLIRLRNPWGTKEWTGAWSDGSSEWDAVSDETKEALGLTVANEGEFWMTFDDFLSNFTSLQLCHLTPDTVHGGGGQRDWSMTQHHGEWIKNVTAGGCGAPPNESDYWINPQYYIRMPEADENDEDGQCTLVVSLLQKYTRLRRTALKTEDTEAAIAFDVYRYRGDQPEQLDGLHADQSALRIERRMYEYEYLRERSYRFSLDPGLYCVMPLTYEVGKEGEFLLRFAAETPIQSGEVDDTTEVTENPTPVKVRKFDRLFSEISGDDDVVDARELRKILNQGLRQEKDEEFSKETCRVIIQSIVGDRRGELSRGDCKHAWRLVKTLQGTFDEFDRDGSGELDAAELRQAFKSLGHKLSKKALGKIVKKYCGKAANLTVDDFVICAIKVTSAQGTFERVRRRRGRTEGDTIDVSFEELLDMTL